MARSASGPKEWTGVPACSQTRSGPARGPTRPDQLKSLASFHLYCESNQIKRTSGVQEAEDFEWQCRTGVTEREEPPEENGQIPEEQNRRRDRGTRVVFENEIDSLHLPVFVGFWVDVVPGLDEHGDQDVPHDHAGDQIVEDEQNGADQLANSVRTRSQCAFCGCLQTAWRISR